MTAFLETTNTERQIKIDPEDYERVSQYKWYEDSQGYARCTIVTRTQMLTEHGIITHRVVENVKLHQFVKPAKVGWSFADGNRLNCQKANLIEYNNTGRPSVHKLGKGIYPSGKKFAAYLTSPKTYLGQFDTVAGAQEAIDRAMCNRR